MKRAVAATTALIASAVLGATGATPASAVTVPQPTLINALQVQDVNSTGATVSEEFGPLDLLAYRTSAAGVQTQLPGQAAGAAVTVHAINNGGWSVGEVKPSVVSDDPTLPARWSPTAALTILAHAATTDPAHPVSYQVLSINSPGISVGTVNRYPNNAKGVQRATRWSTPGQLSILPSSNRPAVANDINDSGTVVGAVGLPHGSFVGVGQQLPALWTATGAYRRLPLLAGDTEGAALAIGSTGLVAGTSGAHAVLWTASGHVVRLAGLAGATSSIAHGVNSHGQAVGEAQLSDGSQVAVLWRDASHVVQLGNVVPTSEFDHAEGYAATGITNSGLVAGWSFIVNEVGEFGRYQGVTWRL